MKLVRKVSAWLLAVVIVAGAGFYAWASFAANRVLSRTVETHVIDLPIPFPLGDDELVGQGLTAEGREALARERALERGRLPTGHHRVGRLWPSPDRGVRTGCHREDLSGGPVAGGDPSWPPASNLTPDASGLAGWSYEQFVAAMREGVRPDGTALRVPMTLMGPYAQRMTDVEMEALWLYLQSVPPVARP